MGAVLNSKTILGPHSLFLLGLVVITAYVPGFTGAAIPTGWLALCLLIPVLILNIEFKFGYGFAFVCYAGLSLLWSNSLNIGLFAYTQILVLACVFLIGYNLKDIRPIFKGLGVGLGICSIVAIAQYFGFRGIFTLNDMVASLFINPNIYSELSALLLISFVVFKLWWFIPTALPGLILVHSRTALLALGLGMLVAIWRMNKKLAVITLIIVMAASLYFYWGQFQTTSITERFALWSDTIKGFTLFGHGVGSYETMFPYYATEINTEIARPKFAHNDILNLIFEFGIGSILILMVLFNVLNHKRKEAIIVWSVMVVSTFTFPFHIPATAFVALLVAGFIVGNTDPNGGTWINWRSIIFKGIIDKKFR